MTFLYNLYILFSISVLYCSFTLSGYLYHGSYLTAKEILEIVSYDFPNLPDIILVTNGAGFIVFVVLLMFNPFTVPSGRYGSAEWATRNEAKKMNILGNTGLILGEAFGRYIKTDQPLSILLLAPPGTGKTAGFVIPNLFSCGNSMIIFDVKGELYNLTSKRRSVFSQVEKFSPASPDSKQWNPLAKEVLPTSWEEKLVTIDRIAALLYQSDKEDYWVTEGKNMFLFFCMFLIWKNGGTSIPEVRSYALSSSEPQEFIEEIIIEHDGQMPQRIVEEGNGLLSKAEKEFASVFSTFKSKLNVFADPYVAKALSGNDFDFADFRKEVISLYLVVKAQDIERLAPVIRILFESAAMYLLSNAPEKEDNIVTLMIDEFARLGKLQTVLDMPALSRGNKGNACLIAQDYAQIKRIYGDGGSEILDGTCSYFILYPQNNQRTAKEFSDKIGNKTLTKKSKSSSSKDILHSSESISEEGLPLFSQQDFLSMPDWTSVILVQNNFKRPIKAKPVKWFEDPLMKNLAGCVDDTLIKDEGKLPDISSPVLIAEITDNEAQVNEESENIININKEELFIEPEPEPEPEIELEIENSVEDESEVNIIDITASMDEEEPENKEENQNTSINLFS